MTELQKRTIKSALLQCAKENENKTTPTFNIVISNVCKGAAERIEELEKQVESMTDTLKAIATDTNEMGGVNMSNRNKNKKVARHMTAEAKKAVIAVKQAVNNQPLRKRIIYALRIIGGRW